MRRKRFNAFVNSILFCRCCVAGVLICAVVGAVGCGKKKKVPENPPESIPLVEEKQSAISQNPRDSLSPVHEVAGLAERFEKLKKANIPLDRVVHDKSYLAWAIFYDNVEASRVVLESGMNVNQIYPGDGLLPIFHAIKSYVEIPPLTEPGRGATPEEVNEYIALKKRQESIDNSKEIFNMLMLYGADVNVSSPASETPLHMAVRKGRLDLVKKLLTHSADIHAWAPYLQATPVMYAAYYGNWEILEYLIRAGADVKDETDDGRTALDYAKERKFEITQEESKPYFPFIDYDKVIEILKQNGAQ